MMAYLRGMGLAVSTFLVFVSAPSWSGAARAAAPYPRSPYITGVTWDRSTYQFGGLGGDLWPTTAGADGKVYAAWGDGVVTCPAYVSFGIAALAGGPSARLQRAGCGPLSFGHGKISGLLDVAGTFYAIVYLQNRPANADLAVWSSPDHGQTWRKPSWVFPGNTSDPLPTSFVNFGEGYGGARDGFVYMLAIKNEDKPTAVYLMRAPKGRLLSEKSYEYFAGTASNPVWSKRVGAAEPIFVDSGGVQGPRMNYDAGIGRYLLMVGHGSSGDSGGKLGMFEGQEPWGAWRTVDYQERWLGISGGIFLGVSFPSPWMVNGGKTPWAVFSCWSHKDKRTGTVPCGAYDDRYNLIRATLKVAPASR
jgi:Domain of unknown function (DUF4185)